MQPQPPPNVPEPPPSQEALRSQRRWQYLVIAGVLSMILLGVAVLAAPLTRRKTKCGWSTPEYVNNARQVGMALYEFESEYGSFPDTSTIAAVRTKSGSTLALGTSTSNDYFRQLLAAGFAQSEHIFYAKVKGGRKPDGVKEGARALSKGEVGFTYLAGLSSSGNPSRPLLVAPVIPGTDRFDPKAFKGMAVLLKMDQSVTSLPIQKDGHVLVDGRNILDPTHPVWDGKPPKIVWPDL